MTLNPVNDETDVAAVWPSELKQREDAPVRDAAIAAETAMFLNYQDDAEYAAAQSDVGRATLQYLDGHGDDREISRSEGEQDEPYRSRVLAIPELVTPLAIVDAVNAILSRYTPVKAQYLESIQDRAYLRFPSSHDGSQPIGEDCAVIGATPIYPTRLYPEDAPNNDGLARVQCSPGGFWLFSDHVGRYFVLRVPDLSALDRDRGAVYFFGIASDAPGRMFLGNGALPSPSYIYSEDASALGVYGAIASAVTAIVGHSIRWKMVSDPRLR